MPSVINKLTVDELRESFRAMPNAVLVDFTGLKARQADGLRARLREQGADMLVVKNSLAALALGELGLGRVAKLLVGQTAFVYGADPAAITRLLRDWGKKERALKWRGAVVEGEVVGPDGVEALATLPSTEVLRGQVLGAMAAPLSRFVGALQGILSQFIGTLKAVADKQEKQG